MLDGAREVSGPQRAQQRHPPDVQRGEQVERHSNWRRCLRRLRPVLLLVGLDRRLVFGQTKLEAHIRIQVTVGQMMRNLPHRPAAGTVWRVEPRIIQASERPAKSRPRGSFRSPMVISRSVGSVVAMLAPKRQTVSSGISPPSTLRPRACGWPYAMAMRDGPDRLASSSYQPLPMRRALRCTSVEAKLL